VLVAEWSLRNTRRHGPSAPKCTGSGTPPRNPPRIGHTCWAGPPDRQAAHGALRKRLNRPG
jgi:hypothetical protein